MSPRRSRHQKPDASLGGCRVLVVMVHFVWLRIPRHHHPRGTAAGQGEARGPTEAAAAWKGSSNPRRDPGDSRVKRSILQTSEHDRGGGGLRFTPGLITQDEICWDQHPYGQALCSACGSQGTNSRPLAAGSKLGDIGSAGVWATHCLLNVVCC